MYITWPWTETETCAFWCEVTYIHHDLASIPCRREAVARGGAPYDELRAGVRRLPLSGK
jgi:hypothetical protein